MIFANAQLGVIVAVAGNRRFVVFFTRLETRVLEGMWHVARWVFRRIVPVDAVIGVARIVRRFVPIIGRALVVWIVIRRVVRLVAVGFLVMGSFYFFLASVCMCHD